MPLAVLLIKNYLPSSSTPYKKIWYEREIWSDPLLFLWMNESIMRNRRELPQATTILEWNHNLFFQNFLSHKIGCALGIDRLTESLTISWSILHWIVTFPSNWRDSLGYWEELKSMSWRAFLRCIISHAYNFDWIESIKGLWRALFRKCSAKVYLNLHFLLECFIIHVLCNDVSLPASTNHECRFVSPYLPFQGKGSPEDTVGFDVSKPYVWTLCSVLEAYGKIIGDVFVYVCFMILYR